jgi:hypothetical protein
MLQADIQPDEAGSRPTPTDETPKSRHALDRVTRELSDEELNSPGARKLLLDRLSQEEDEISSLKSFRERFHEADKRNGVLEEKLKKDTAVEVISTGTVAVGAAALVYAPELWSHQPGGWIALAFGAILTLVGIAAKVMRA